MCEAGSICVKPAARRPGAGLQATQLVLTPPSLLDWGLSEPEWSGVRNRMQVLEVNIPVCFSLQELCRKLHAKIESVDEERYDIEVKLQKTNKEVSFPQSHPSGESPVHPLCLPVLLGSVLEAHALLSLFPSSFHSPVAGRLEPEAL